MCKSLFRSTLVAGLIMQGLCLAQSMVPIDPATVADGHVYLFEGGAPTRRISLKVSVINK